MILNDYYLPRVSISQYYVRLLKESDEPETRAHLHPSTVSRATREKYLQCRQGTYPLRYFFSRALGEQGPSQQTVKLRLLELIRQEDHSRPLSDQKLAELLAEQGIRIARRTVAKYRTELRLGSAAARKRD